MISSDESSLLLRAGTRIENGIQVWLAVSFNSHAENRTTLKKLKSYEAICRSS
jgi:hypothetical protein